MNNKIKEMSEYCLNCKIKPCSNKGCPLNNNIPEFIYNVKQGNLEEAYNILNQTTVLSPICGKICPHEKQCQGNCIRGLKDKPVSIGNLENFIGEYGIKNNISIEKKDLGIRKKIAIIGGGPSGLTAAAFLAKNGIDVTIYERYSYLGGLLMYGIPEFRLEKELVKSTVDKILNLGIKVEYNKELGQNLKLEDLLQKFDYIYISIGANVSTNMGIDGENLNGVYGGNELLEYGNHPNYSDKTVIVNGGGNVAMDTARTIKKLGAKEVIVIYRRDREQMPAEKKEIEDAMNEGIEFLFKHNILKINGNDRVENIEVIKTELIKKEGENRLYPVNIDNSNYKINADYVVMALGSKSKNYVKSFELELDKKGYIKVDENGMTSNSKVYAGGDISSNGKGTVAWAARQGRDFAIKLIESLKN